MRPTIPILCFSSLSACRRLCKWQWYMEAKIVTETGMKYKSMWKENDGYGNET